MRRWSKIVESLGQKANVFEFADPRQKLIYERLLNIGPGPAGFFRDACRLMTQSDSFDTTTHLVAHALREVESGLRAVLESLAARSARTAKKGPSEKEAHRAEILAILESLEIPLTDPVAQAWLRIAGKENVHGLPARAHRKNLAEPPQVDKEFLEFWEDMQRILSITLERLESHYLGIFEVLDGLLAKEDPAKQDILTLQQHIPQNLITLQYFFDRLQSVRWLKPLEAAGFFSEPPAAVEDKDQGTIGFPMWPQSRYLLRVASHDPEQVLAVILKVPPTSNEGIHTDFADAAATMPPSLAAQWARSELAWLRVTPYLYQLLPAKLGALIRYLADANEADAALSLAQELLPLVPGRNLGEEEQHLSEPRSRFWAYYYKNVLDEDIPALVPKRPNEVLHLLSECLSQAISLSVSPQHRSLWLDDSYIWHPAIEGAGRLRSEEITDALISAVRITSEKVAEHDPASIGAVVQKLESYRWPTFRRLALHILRVCPSNADALTRERLVDRENLDSIYVWHEYFLLLKQRFKYLADSDRDAILAMIADGPDFGKYRAGAFPNDTEREKHKKGWQQNRLAAIKDDLPPSWAKVYQDLVNVAGEPDHPDYVIWTEEARWGWASPKDADDMKAMEMDEVMKFLRDWEPAQDQFGSTPEGLARQLTTVVASDPDRFTSYLEEFQGLDPTYVKAFVTGIRERISQKRRFDYEAVLDLCKGVVGQPKDIPGRKRHSIDQDPDWSGTRLEILRMLQAGLEPCEVEIPIALRSKVWDIIEPLTHDTSPTPEEEAQYGTSPMDSVTLSMNTTRGQAMQTVMHYARMKALVN